MSPTITLNVSDDALERAQVIAQRDGTTIEAVLTHCIEFGTTDDHATLIENGYVHMLRTSHVMAQALEAFMNEQIKKRDRQDQAE